MLTLIYKYLTKINNQTIQMLRKKKTIKFVLYDIKLILWKFKKYFLLVNANKTTDKNMMSTIVLYVFYPFGFKNIN